METNSLVGRRVLILGGLGFIGSNLTIRLASLGAKVVVVDSMLPCYGGNLLNIEPVKDQIDINFSDIRDIYSLEYLVKGVEYIFSVAGQTSHLLSMTDPFTDLDINCRAQLSILECCRKFNRDVTIINASTRQVYGKPLSLPVNENHPLVPTDVNGINKVASEHYYALYSKLYGIRCVSLRLTNTYGPRQQLRGNDQGFTGIFIRNALTQNRIDIFGDGTQKRDFNYIDDVVDAFILVAENTTLESHIYNLGTEKVYTLLDFLKILNGICPLEYRLVPFPPDHAAIDIGDFQADYSKLKAETGWKPRIDLAEGLARTVDYFRPKIEGYL
jgi:nucleoside-diphosphate-sugar epimerase